MDNIFTNIKLNDYQEIKLDLSISAFEVFKRLYPYCNNLFLLESLGEEGQYNRFSYVSFEPEFLLSAYDKSLVINGKSYLSENPYHFLKDKIMSPILKQACRKLNRRVQDNEVNVDNFCGGLVGFVSHEATKYFEPAFVGHKLYDFPEFAFGFFSDGLVFERQGKRVVYFHHGKNRVRKLQLLINKSGKLNYFSYKKLVQKDLKKRHKIMVKKAKKHIKHGDVFQVVLSIKTQYQISGDKRRIYADLRKVNPSPYMSYLKFGRREIISASPELLIRVKGRQIEHSGTLAGTIRRGNTSKEDSLLKDKLRKDEKEMAEHMMLVDLARNDLGRICQLGSVKVSKLTQVKSYEFVHHLYSEVKGKLKKEENALSALSSCFPAGTLTGAPKIEAMKIIKRFEGQSRGPYGGVIGYYSFNGEAMFAIAIRSLFINGDSAYTQTGSGIVYDSDPEREYQEILHKQRGMEEALKRAARKI